MKTLFKISTGRKKAGEGQNEREKESKRKKYLY
jgi:hypothetical protein